MINIGHCFEIATEAYNAELAFSGQGAYKNTQSISGNLHTIGYAHTSATVYDKYEMKVFALAKLLLFGLFVFENLKKVLRLHWIKRWHKRN